MKNGKITKRDKQFAKALRFIAESESHDSKALAKLSGRTQRTIGYVLSLQRGLGRDAAFTLAEGLGTTYSDMLSLGQYIIENGTAEGWNDNKKAIININGDENMNRMVTWINMQDDPAAFWTELSQHLKRLEPDFAEYAKKTTEQKSINCT